MKIVEWLSSYGGLIGLAFYTMLSNTFLMLIPHEPVLVAYGKLYPTEWVALVAGVSVCIVELFNYHSINLIADRTRLSTYIQTTTYRRAEKLFLWQPFASVVIAALTPIPFAPFRLLAATSRYDLRRYIVGIFIGRLPRFYLLAWAGKALNLPLWMYGTLLASAFLLVWIRKRSVRKKKQDIQNSHFWSLLM